jgi:hypothetical protein
MPQRKTAMGATNAPIVIEDEENDLDDINDNKI